MKLAKREYYQKHLKAVKNDVKGTWKVINEHFTKVPGKLVEKSYSYSLQVFILANHTNKKKQKIKLKYGMQYGKNEKL